MQRKQKYVLFLIAATVISFAWFLMTLNRSQTHEPLSRQNEQQHPEENEAETTGDGRDNRTRDAASNAHGSIRDTTNTSTSASTATTTTTQSAPQPPRIPLIFHQIYKDTALPAPYGICFYSLLRNHRFRDGRQDRNASVYRGEFDYYFWTDQSIKEYKEDHSSAPSAGNASAGRLGKEFEYFKSARETVEVADMVRYFFLYEYGGIYMDLDMEPVSSFLPLLERGYPCVLSEENPIQVSSARRTLSPTLMYSHKHETPPYLLCVLVARGRCSDTTDVPTVHCVPTQV